MMYIDFTYCPTVLSSSFSRSSLLSALSLEKSQERKCYEKLEQELINPQGQGHRRCYGYLEVDESDFSESS